MNGVILEIDKRELNHCLLPHLPLSPLSKLLSLAISNLSVIGFCAFRNILSMELPRLLQERIKPLEATVGGSRQFALLPLQSSYV
ncbi:hypothetical protein RUM43_012104 [Polyplax serrata]|uniref:Uncharacterized protein n=1 Tax=Polyplax serrata TaxID=468196 RepID=A0AAN8P220_POLSC